MKMIKTLTNAILYALTSMGCRIEDTELEKVPAEGPLIAAANHINFLEVPINILRLAPRPVTGFSKIENWDNRFYKFLFTLWDVIPITRGEVDREAFRQAEDALKHKKILAVAPEGTRSKDATLQRGLPGVVILALRSGAPILPMVAFGHENFHQNIRHLKRTDYKIRVGTPFHLDAGENARSREARQQMTDEIMYQIAALLPPQYRGVYSDLSQATETYLQFEPGAASSLQKALS